MVLKTFIECVAQIGIENTTYRLLAERAGVSMGTVQYYFPDKNSLINEALRYEHSRYLSMASPARADASIVEKLEKRFEAWLPLTEETRRRWPFWVEYWARSTREETLSSYHLQRWQNIAENIEALIREESKASPSGLDPRDIADALVAFVHGLGLRSTIHPSRFTITRTKRILQGVIEALVGEAPTQRKRSTYKHEAPFEVAPD